MDPLVGPLDPKQWNRYVYVGDDPVNFVDPTGLNSISNWFSNAWDCVTSSVSHHRGWSSRVLRC
jgi:hypothetical protein